MLLDFSAENFQSIGEMQKLNLLTGNTRGQKHHLLKAYTKKVLKFSTMYGANGAGKSTIIKAMHFGKKVIVNGYFNKKFMSINKCSLKWENEYSDLVYRIFINKKIYEYGITLYYSKEEIAKEWLIEENSKGDKKTIFYRDIEDKKNNRLNMKVNKKSVNERISIYFEDISNENNALFLSEINNKKGDLFKGNESLKYLREIYNWFSSKLKFVYPDSTSDLGEYSFINAFGDKEYIGYLKELDISISDMKYVNISADIAFKDIPDKIIKEVEDDFKAIYLKENIDKEKKEDVEVFLRIGGNYLIIKANEEGFSEIKTIEFLHGKYGSYKYKEESDGTRRILELLEIISSKEESVTYVVDEIDRSLHPLLTEKLVDLYLNPINPNKNQLIITTHESRLLNLSKLRRDEIYFIYMDEGQSKLTRLDEYSTSISRTDLNIETAYLNGRYAGVPNIIH